MNISRQVCIGLSFILSVPALAEHVEIKPNQPRIGFGSAIAVDNDVFVASTFYAYQYVFRLVGGVWLEEQRLQSMPPVHSGPVQLAAGRGFLFISAPDESGGGTVYVFKHNGTTWLQVQRIVPVPFGTILGIGLDAAEGILAIGSWRNAGQLDIYREAAGAWSFEQTLAQPADQQSFARAFSVDGNRIAVASPDQRTVSVYSFLDGSWDFESALTGTASGFGSGIALQNDELFVGSSSDNPWFLYSWNGAEWTVRNTWNSPQSHTESYNARVSMYGESILVALPFFFRKCEGEWVPEGPPHGLHVFGPVAMDEKWAVVGDPDNGSVLVMPSEPDCDSNDVKDACDILEGTLVDCDASSAPDICESGDCNGNGVVDFCDVAHNTSYDVDRNWVPDECDDFECVRECTGSCVSLKAAKVNEKTVEPNNCVDANPGDQIAADLFISGWYGLVPQVRGYQIRLLGTAGATSGQKGTLLPVGWNAPIQTRVCIGHFDCPAEFPICTAGGRCVGSSHNPSLGAFVTRSRPDFILREFVPEVLGGVNVNNLNFEYGHAAADSDGTLDDGTEYYAGTLILKASTNACGSFVFQIDEDIERSFLIDASPAAPSYPLDSQPLVVNICTDDGIFCNGLERCDPITGCIIDPPNCDDGNDCTADSCNSETDSCDHTPINCPDFVPIPTVSNWGLTVVALALLIGAKLRFKRKKLSG